MYKRDTSPENQSSKQPAGWYFFLIFFAFKPLIDLTWSINFGSFFGAGLNLPRLAAIIIFFVLLLLFFRNPRIVKSFGLIIFLFLFIQILAIMSNVILGLVSAGYGINILLRGFDAFLILLIFSRYWTSREMILQMVLIIWLSLFLVNIVSILVFLSGFGNVSITVGVERFAGLYNDAGGPAYNGIFGIMFAFLSREMLLQTRRLKLINVYSIIFYITVFSGLFLVWVSLTKSAFLMLLIFILLWWGVHKKKYFVTVPAMIIGSIYLFLSNNLLQERFQDEINVFVEGDYSREALSSLGTGRVTTWIDVMTHFSRQDLFHQLLGAGRDFGAHNQFIAYLMLFGIFGLLVFLILIASLMVRVINRYRMLPLPEFMMAIAMMWVFIANSFTGHPFLWSTSLWHLMILISFSLVPIKKMGEWKEFRLNANGQV